MLSDTAQRACISVAINEDTIVEATEQFILQLSTDDPQARLTTDSAVVSIIDNDSERIILTLVKNSLLSEEFNSSYGLCS